MNSIEKECETHICKAIFPNTLNANNTLFGGIVMQWMDEVAYITATRYTHQRMFTVKVDAITFLKTVSEGMFVDVIGKIEKVGPVKLTVQVEIWAEEMYGTERYKAIEGKFVFAILDSENKPQRLEIKV